MLKELCVIGHPGRCGGASSELDHQIRCWHAMGVTVHLCPTSPPDVNARAMRMEDRGCIYHAPCDWPSIAGMHVISYCSRDFLRTLPEIRKHARTTTFVNCMSWAFDAEVAAVQQGLIDFELYQTVHSMEKIAERLQGANELERLLIHPYFHAADFPFQPREPGLFRFGRISRSAPDKFGKKQLWIYETMTAPEHKQGLILGWGAEVEKKLGRPPFWIGTMPSCSLSQQAFYQFANAVIMTTAGTENLPRVGFEAMASGSVLVVDDRGGWQLQVEDGSTGWLCKDEREFVYKASRLAHEKDEAADMRHAARQKVETAWGLNPAMESWSRVFEAWEAKETLRESCRGS